MLYFIDGLIVIPTVEQNIDLYYRAYVAEFGEISRTRWEGSKEYEIAYANAQRDFENAVLFEQSLTKVLNSISDINEAIKRPAVLHSRVAERFAEEGYVATIRQNEADVETRFRRSIFLKANPSLAGQIGFGDAWNTSTPYGAMDSQRTLETNAIISSFQADTAGGDGCRFMIAEAAFGDSVDVEFVGHGVVTFSWNGVDQYGVIDPALAAFIAASVDTVIEVYINDPTEVEVSESTRGVVAICVDQETELTLRTMTVGNNGADVYGFNRINFGAMDDTSWFADEAGQGLYEFVTNQVTKDVILTGEGGAKWNNQDSIIVDLVGTANMTMTWNVTNSRYEANNTLISDTIVAADGTDIVINIDDEKTDTNDDDPFIAQLIADEMLPAGQHMEGDRQRNVTLSNGQEIVIQWRTPVVNTIDWKLEITINRNSQHPVDDVDTIIEKFLANFNAANAMGQDIIPELYFQIERDAPYASKIVASHDINASGTYITDIVESEFFDKYSATLVPANVTLLG